MSGRAAAAAKPAKAKAEGAQKAEQAAPAKAKADKGEKKKGPAMLNNANCAHSAARAQIAQDVIDDCVPKTGPFDSKQIFDTLHANDKRFKNFPHNKDTCDHRINSLRKGIDDDLKEAMEDHDAALEDLLLHPPEDKNTRGQLRWEGSATERLLEQDVVDKLHEGVSPEAFQATRNACLLFDLSVFAKHLHQLVKALKPHHSKDKLHRRKKRHHGDKVSSGKEQGSDENELHQTKRRPLKSKLAARTEKQHRFNFASHCVARTAQLRLCNQLAHFWAHFWARFWAHFWAHTWLTLGSLSAHFLAGLIFGLIFGLTPFCEPNEPQARLDPFLALKKSNMACPLHVAEKQ